jgi:uncharacterized protein involved in exopolysaccharide biosynthesis
LISAINAQNELRNIKSEKYQDIDVRHEDETMGSLTKTLKTKRNRRDLKIAKARVKKEAKKARDEAKKEGVIVVH